MSKDGGQAFPVPCAQSIDGGIHWAEYGMSLRAYFAAHAPAMTEQWWLDNGGAQRHWIDAQAAYSVAHADALLKALEQ